jgi:hypothetical protein
MKTRFPDGTPCYLIALRRSKRGKPSGHAIRRLRRAVFSEFFEYAKESVVFGHSVGAMVFRLRDGVDPSEALRYWPDHGVCPACLHRAITAGTCCMCGADPDKVKSPYKPKAKAKK